MFKQPKRRKHKDNPYVINYHENENKYFVSFKDGKGIYNVVEINQTIYEEFNKFELEDLSQLNQYDNHIEHFQLSEQVLSKRSIYKNMGVEELVEIRIKLSKINQIILSLPMTQKRRFKKYFFDNKTFEQIAKEEKCTKRAIKFSVDIAKKKILEKISN